MEKFLCSLIGRINNVKITILPKANTDSMQSLVKITTQFFIVLETAILKFIWNNKKPRIAKTIINKKSTSVGISIPDLKQCYRAIMIKMHGIGDRQVDQWNWIEDPEMITPIYGHLIFNKGIKTIQWKKDSLFNEWCWFNLHLADNIKWYRIPLPLPVDRNVHSLFNHMTYLPGNKVVFP